jgi:hypothetical protein
VIYIFSPQPAGAEYDNLVVGCVILGEKFGGLGNIAYLCAQNFSIN